MLGQLLVDLRAGAEEFFLGVPDFAVDFAADDFAVLLAAVRGFVARLAVERFRVVVGFDRDADERDDVDRDAEPVRAIWRPLELLPFCMVRILITAPLPRSLSVS